MGARRFFGQTLRRYYKYVPVVLVVVVSVAYGALALLPGRPSDSSAGLDGKPLAVGAFPYINACNAFTSEAFRQVFRVTPDDSYIVESYAQISPDVTQTEPSAVSSCARHTSPDDAVSGVTLDIIQFISVDKARQRFEELAREHHRYNTEYNEAMPEVLEDAGEGAFIGTWGGLAAYGLQDNLLVKVEVDQRTQVPRQQELRADLGRITQEIFKNAKNPKLARVQQRNTDLRVGADLYRYPCDLFTADDFKRVFGFAANQAAVVATYANALPVAGNPADGYCSWARKVNLGAALAGTPDESMVSLATIHVTQHADIDAATKDFEQRLGTISNPNESVIQTKIDKLGEDAFYTATTALAVTANTSQLENPSGNPIGVNSNDTLTVLDGVFVIEVSYGNGQIRPADTSKSYKDNVRRIAEAALANIAEGR